MLCRTTKFERLEKVSSKNTKKLDLNLAGLKVGKYFQIVAKLYIIISTLYYITKACLEKCFCANFINISQKLIDIFRIKPTRLTKIILCSSHGWGNSLIDSTHFRHQTIAYSRLFFHLIFYLAYWPIYNVLSDAEVSTSYIWGLWEIFTLVYPFFAFGYIIIGKICLINCIEISQILTDTFGKKSRKGLRSLCTVYGVLKSYVPIMTIYIRVCCSCLKCGIASWKKWYKEPQLSQNISKISPKICQNPVRHMLETMLPMLLRIFRSILLKLNIVLNLAQILSWIWRNISVVNF